MVENVFMDSLVKLASLGTSGICIFAIFWVGWLIKGAVASASPESHKTIRSYMFLCLFIAVISATSGSLNAYFNAAAIEREKRGKEQALVEKEQAVAQQSELKETLNKATLVLNSQLVAEAVTRSAPVVRQQAEQVKTTVTQLRLITPHTLEPVERHRIDGPR